MQEPLFVTRLAERSRLSATVLLVGGMLLAGISCGPPQDDDGDVPAIPGPDSADEEPDVDAAPGDDAAADTFADVSDAADDADAGDDGGIPENCSSANPVDASERTEIEISEWTYGMPSDSGNQKVISALRSGKFEVPDTYDYGTSWFSESAGKDGEVPHSNASGPRTLIYAATEVEVDQPKTLVVEADDLFRVFAAGRTYPGGVYGHGDKRIAVELEAGKNALVVQFLGRQSPKVRLFETPDVMAFNKKDMTTPELRVGHSTNQPAGVHVLNLAGRALKDVKAEVLDSKHFKATTVEYPFLAPNSATQIAFDLEPKSAWSNAGKKIPVDLAISSCGTTDAYRTTIELKTVAQTDAFKRTFRSPVDDSAQYYAVQPPSNFAAPKRYDLTLALHGAGVEAKGHITSYAKKDWTYQVAPTNRRRFGFNWEEWGKFNGINALDDAMSTFTIDETGVYLTGHSMGGHGTWHLGIMHPGRFATVGPSAGWESIYNYGSSTSKPQGALRRARAHSETARYLENLADRGAYIVHGGQDNNVPTKHGRTMRDKLKMYTSDVKYHEEPGAGHVWDHQDTPGKDAFDWGPMFTFFQNHSLDPYELEFKFKAPGPWYTDEHSYVRVRSSENPMNDYVLESTKTSSTKVELTTTNVRSMEIDGKALSDKGIQEIVIDGTTKQVMSSTTTVGPQDGKKPGKNGTFNQVLREPFCFVYPDGNNAHRAYASYLVTNWAVRGNGHACAFPASQLDSDIRADRNLVFLGTHFENIPDHGNRPFGWQPDRVSVGPNAYGQGVIQVAFPTADGMGGAITAVDGSEDLLYSIRPFSSRSGMPDYLILGRTQSGGVGVAAVGFFDNDWKFDPTLGTQQ